MIVGGTSTTAPQAISADGNPTGITIPTYSIDTADATALRDYLCPAPTAPPPPPGPTVACGPGGQPLTGAMVDSPGSGGALRVLDVTNPAAPTLRGVYRPPPSLVFPPPDLGVYSVHNAVARGPIAYVAAHANGVRVVDLNKCKPDRDRVVRSVRYGGPDDGNNGQGGRHGSRGHRERQCCG
ncbi:MAG: hypothetical protein M3065_12260 [Actinomycetota bacterium]|nr:hypothetical protein [Actinomycetota bacterium]